MTSLLSVLFGADFARKVRSNNLPKTPTVAHGNVERFLRFGGDGGGGNGGGASTTAEREALARAQARWVASLAADFGLSRGGPFATLRLSNSEAGSRVTEATPSPQERIVVLLEGRERWHVGGPATASSMSLRKGSALFLPRGLEVSRDVLSASRAAVFLLTPPTWLDLVLDRVSHALVQESAWRRPLPPSFGPRKKEALRSLTKLLANLETTLGPLEAAELCEFFQARRAAFGANPSGRDRAFMLAKGSKLKRIGKSPAQAQETEPWLLVSRTRRVELDVDLATVPLLAWIATHPHPARFSMTEALEHGGPLTFEEVITLLELLARHDVIRLEQAS